MGLHESKKKTKNKKQERCRRRANVLLRVEALAALGTAAS